MNGEVEMNSFVANVGLSEFEGEPRARDLDIADRLGFSQPRDIRKLIKRHSAELEQFGPSRHRGAMVDIGSGAKREVQEYWLNEGQALLVSILSDAPNAPAVQGFRLVAAILGKQTRKLIILPTRRAQNSSIPE
jgi:hypothetical protein